MSARARIACAVAALALALAACDGSGGPAPSTEPATFVPDAPSEGSEVFLRGASARDDVYVEVVAKGPPEINAAALRLLFDPAALTFVEAAPGPHWSRGAVTIAKEGTPGQIAIAWAEKGATGFAASDETVLGTLRFQRKNRDASTISFFAERSSLVDKKGAPVRVTFRGGSVRAR